MNIRASLKAAAAIALGMAALAAAPGAQARSNVYWSVGINPAPGVAVGVGNAPFYAQPAQIYAPTVYAAPPVVYTQPPVVYSQPRVVYAPPVYVAPAPVYYGHRHHHHRGGYYRY